MACLHSEESNKMSEIRGVYTLWLTGNQTVLPRQNPAGYQFIQPLLWLVIFAAGFGVQVCYSWLNLSTSHFSRHNWSNIAFHSDVHGHKRYLGQRIRLHERNPCFPGFTFHHFPWKNGRRQLQLRFFRA